MRTINWHCRRCQKTWTEQRGEARDFPQQLDEHTFCDGCLDAMRLTVIAARGRSHREIGRRVTAGLTVLAIVIAVSALLTDPLLAQQPCRT